VEIYLENVRDLLADARFSHSPSFQQRQPNLPAASPQQTHHHHHHHQHQASGLDVRETPDKVC
jgi:hypothetical protein